MTLSHSPRTDALSFLCADSATFRFSAATGQTTIAFTEGTGVHYIPINATTGYTAYDAVLSPDPNLKIDTSSNGLSLVFNSSAAAVNEVASVTLGECRCLFSLSCKDDMVSVGRRQGWQLDLKLASVKHK